MSNKHQLQIALLAVQQSQLRARYYEQRIATGTYKQRAGTIFHSILSEQGSPLSEQELLCDELSIMHKHIKRAEAHLEYAKELLHKAVIA